MSCAEEAELTKLVKEQKIDALGTKSLLLAGLNKELVS